MFEYFPGNYSVSQSILIALIGGANISEIDEACSPLKELSDHGDEHAQEAWHESWKTLGKRSEGLAARDEESGRYLSAGRKYLSAANYYIIAERHVSNRDPRKLETYTRGLEAFKKGIQLGGEPVEFVEIPFKDASLPALYIPPFGEGPAPCMIHFDGSDTLKESIYLAHRQEFRRRGIALLIVDHPGVGEALRLRNIHLEPESEFPAAACVDYLESRSDIDSDRIGIMALSLGGYWAPRAAAFEKRLKCCVAWGACWEFETFVRETAARSGLSFQFGWSSGKDTVEEALEVAKKLTLEGIADKIICPLLVLHGENDRLLPLWHAEKTIEKAVNSPGRELKVFTHAEGGSEHCQVDNNAMGVEYMADWVAEKLGGNPKGV